MARGKGSANLAASLEVLAGAPLDARLVVDAKSDLTASGSYPYHYQGMIVSVKAENKAYMLIGNDPTLEANWQEFSGGGSSGEQIQYSTMPTASADNVGQIVQYIGETGDYNNGYFYQCTENEGTYSWVAKNVQAGGSGSATDYTDLDNKPTINEVTLNGNKTSSDLGLQDVLQFTIMPGATVDTVGKVVQYVGETGAYTKGHFYEGISDSQGVTFSWTEIEFGGSGGTTDYEDLTNKPEINSVELSGRKSLSDLGIQKEMQFATMPEASADNLGAVVQFVGTTDASYTNGYFYECTTDGTTYSWTAKNVQASGGGGSSALESNVTSNLAVGAIASGTTITQGTTFTEFVQKLLITELAPTIAFSISKSGNVLYGGSYTETLTVNVSNMGTAKSIDTIAWYEGSTLLQTDTIDSTVAGSWTYTMATATTDTTTFKAIVTYKKSDNTHTTDTKTASISFFYNKFYGSVGSLTPDEATVTALSTALGTAKGGTYTFTTSAARIAYAYPASLGNLTSIKDGNGFSLFDSFTKTTQTYTQKGTSVSYNLYVLTDATTVSGYKVTFA